MVARLQLGEQAGVVDRGGDMQSEGGKQVQRFGNQPRATVPVVRHEQAQSAAAGEEGDGDEAGCAKRLGRAVHQPRPRPGIVDEERPFVPDGVAQGTCVRDEDFNRLFERVPVLLRHARSRHINQPVPFGRDSPEVETVDGDGLPSDFQHMSQLLPERERLPARDGQPEDLPHGHGVLSEVILRSCYPTRGRVAAKQ